MGFGPTGGYRLRAWIAGLKQRLSSAADEERAEEAARRLDADEVGARADRRAADHQVEPARPKDPAQEAD